MQKTVRRTFLRNTLAGSALLLAPRRLSAAEAQVELLINEPIATVSPDLYGHMTEHIGGVIYDGIWVGEGSKIPNVGGIRTELVDYTRKLKPSVVRWPGGCFADSYNWRDGIGPRNQRPCRTNFWINDLSLHGAPDGPQKYEPNHFGTNEFVRFCRQIGAQPYIAVNVRSLPARDFYEWVEYCNAPAGLTTLSKMRGEAGDSEPFGVRFWGIGNESWGCGGNFTPEEYATLYRQFATWAPSFGQELRFIAAGPNGGDIQWTHGFFSKLTERDKTLLGSVYGWALHYYCGTTGKGHAIDFTTGDWYELLARADRMERLIQDHWAAMGEIDTEHRVKLVVDEWGAWHRAGTEIHPAHLFEQVPTMRDALISALTLDIFNRHAEKIAMANVAQLVNNLHCLFLAREEKFITTPNYDVFEMYTAHYGGQSIRTIFSAPRAAYEYEGKPGSLWGLAGSASLRGKQLVLTAVNPHVSEARETEIRARGATIRSCQVRTLTADDIHAHNSFDKPRAVQPKDSEVSPRGQTLLYRFPPASVTRLTLDLA
jgi:alpha-N-arabinofuranosidase